MCECVRTRGRAAPTKMQRNTAKAQTHARTSRRNTIGASSSSAYACSWDERREGIKGSFVAECGRTGSMGYETAHTVCTRSVDDDAAAAATIQCWWCCRWRRWRWWWSSSWSTRREIRSAQNTCVHACQCMRVVVCKRVREYLSVIINMYNRGVCESVRVCTSIWCQWCFACERVRAIRFPASRGTSAQ